MSKIDKDRIARPNHSVQVYCVTPDGEWALFDGKGKYKRCSPGFNLGHWEGAAKAFRKAVGDHFEVDDK